MDIFQKHKKVFLFVGIFIGVVILYELFFSGGGSAPQNAALSPTADGLVSQLSASPSDAIVGSSLLSLLAQLQTISLDTSIFTNPVFVSLQDWSQPIAEQPLGKTLGRPNPFSGFSGASAITGGAAGTTVISPAALGSPTIPAH